MKEEKWNTQTIQELKPPVEPQKAPIPAKKIEVDAKPNITIDEKLKN